MPLFGKPSDRWHPQAYPFGDALPEDTPSRSDAKTRLGERARLRVPPRGMAPRWVAKCPPTVVGGLIALIVASAAFLAAAAWAAAPASSPVSGNKAAWDDYRLIVERNIFSRDRVAPSRGDRSAYGRSASAAGESGLTLTGVAVQGELRVAFIEDSRTGEMVRATVGQAIGSGVIAAVRLDGVDYRRDGTTQTINIGESLSGSSATTEPSLSASSQPAGAEAAGAEATPAKAPSSANSVEERMRLRRLQELKP